MKILYVTTVSGTMNFFIEHFKMLQAQGHVVEIAANMVKPLDEELKACTSKFHQLPFSRSPLSKDNIKAFHLLKQLLQEGNYDIVHTHTPNASALVRLAARKLRRDHLRVIYTAHGFHFYKGAPLKNWMVFYPIEWLTAHWTDVLITINREDYKLAQKRMHAKIVEYVPGVGLDTAKFHNTSIDFKQKREELGVPENAALLTSVGELNVNKNHRVVISALAKLNNPNIHYVIAGVGEQKENLMQLAEKLNVKDQVHFLGFRRDVAEIYQCSDVYILPSYREGLNVSLMEAMASGLPCIAGNIRGNVDLIKNEEGGFLVNVSDPDQIGSKIERLITDKQLRTKMGETNIKNIESFDIAVIKEKLQKIYC